MKGTVSNQLLFKTKNKNQKCILLFTHIKIHIQLYQLLFVKDEWMCDVHEVGSSQSIGLSNEVVLVHGDIYEWMVKTI